jgi:hypothetical protein
MGMAGSGVVIGGEGWWFAAGFVVLNVAFVGHIIINAMLKTGFSAGETALGIFGFAAVLAALLTTVLVGPSDFAMRIFMPVGLGLISMVVTVVASMLISFGPQKAFEKFDVIRDNNLRPASRLPHRGGRR